MRLQTFEPEFGVISFNADAFDEVTTNPETRTKIIDMCNLVKYNTEIQRTLYELVEGGILISTGEDGLPADMAAVKADVATNDVVLAWLVAKYDLVLWSSDEISDRISKAVERNSSE